MPTSVLLAVLAAAGLLALAPALTRRFDATERIAAERAASTARVLTRRRRRRTVPGRYPVNPIRGGAVAGAEVGSDRTPTRSPRRRPGGPGGSGRPGVAHRQPRRSAPGPRRRRPGPTAVHRRRRVFVALVVLNIVELVGVALVGAGLWIGFSVSFALLLADLVHLRRRALAATRQRRIQARHAAWVAAQQAAVRREHQRRASRRQAAARQAVMEREDARREAIRRAGEYVERYRPTVGL